MILAAALLVLVGLGLFVAGLVTGVTVLYWACVAACVVAAVLLFGARRQVPADASAPSDGAGSPRTEAADQPAADRTAAEPAPVEPASVEPAATGDAVPAEPAPAAAAAGATAVSAVPPAGAAAEQDDPPVEEVEVTDLLLVIDLTDEVLVVDEHPRYHVAGCSWLGSRSTIPLPLDEARTDGFTPCGICRPDATLADRVRAQR